MKRVKRYILVTLSLLLIAIIGAVVVWYFLVLAPIKSAQEKIHNSYEQTEQLGEKVIQEIGDRLDQDIDTDIVSTNFEDAVESVESYSQIMIQKSSLPEAQQSILTTFGFGEQIVITPQMQACAEVKLGVSRLDEIVAGAAPSFAEATALVGCLKN